MVIEERKIRTGILVLDTMLFGDEYDGRHARAKPGFAPGDVVLIRGEPGTGKTTLALQIASNLRRAENGAVITYVSLEESLDTQNRRAEYDFSTDVFMASIQWLRREGLELMLRDVLRSTPDGARPAGIAAEMAKAAAEGLAGQLGGSAEGLAKAAAIGLIAVLRPLLEAFFSRVARAVQPADGRPQGYPRLLVVDSLGALMNVLMNALPGIEPRLLFNEFCRFIRTAPARDGGDPDVLAPIIIIIGEHHFSDGDAHKSFPESFVCDAEIVLRPEPLRVPRDSSGTDKIALGYHLAAVVDPEAKHLETRSFCRVVKSRYSRNQSRRCAYDIEPGRGIRFFETYPGDGKLMLFAENEQQRSAWGSFFQRDLTDAYPALRYEVFTMAGMETVYESSRRLLQVPLRTDMFLSSLDSYWVLGYRDYRLKTKINDNLNRIMKPEWRKTLGATVDGRSPSSSWVCMEYPRLVNDLVWYAMRTLDKSLYESTRNELLGRPEPTRDHRLQRARGRVARLEDWANDLEGEVARHKWEIGERYDWLCQRVFGKKAAELLTTSGVLPAPDLRETFLRPLPRSQMTLFGQYNAELLPYLARDDMHQFHDGEDYWLCVPYDANIGVFVARLDLLEGIVSDDATTKKYDEAYKALKAREGEVLDAALAKIELLVWGEDEEERKAMREAVGASLRGPLDKCETEKIAGGRTLQKVLVSAHFGERLSWDEIICLSIVAGKPLGIETRNFDTLMAFFLELVWNCGGRLEVDGRYRIRNKAEVLCPLVRALHYFRALFTLVGTPANQTIDPSLFAEGPGRQDGYGEWLFARYWYSSLVDALTATRPRPGTEQRDFIWKSGRDKVRIEILPMPRGKQHLPNDKDKVDEHFACSGEWSFALLAGSENVALGCDLISNLMGSLKVTERGLHGACLPTVSQFYTRHASERCIPPTIRSDIEPPRMTFGKLGSTYLGVSQSDERASDAQKGAPRRAVDKPHRAKAIFRQAIFDYRHCAREIFGELMGLRDDVDDQGDEGKVVVGACLRMLRGIDELGGRYIFIRDPFRNDVATVTMQGADSRSDWTDREVRLPRIDVHGNPAVIQGKPVELMTLSRSGCRLLGDEKREEGKSVAVVIAEKTLTSTVVWSDNGVTAVAFDKVVSYAQFGEIVERLSIAPRTRRPRGKPPS